MTEKRFTTKSQDDYFGVIDNNVGDNVCVVNGIHTLIEAEWLCEVLNSLINENEQLKQFIKDLVTKGTGRIDLANGYSYSVSTVLTNWKGDVE